MLTIRRPCPARRWDSQTPPDLPTTTMPLFTIITANFRSGAKLRDTLASVRGQASDHEHLIVDGGSTDGSLDIARAAAAVDARVRVTSEADAGIYDAMNKGVALARGRYILFLGAGDVLLPDVLPRVAAVLPDHDRGFVYGDVSVNPGGATYNGRFSWRQLYYLNVCHQSIFYGRDLFARLGGYDLRFRAYADWDFNLRCFGTRWVRKRYVPITVSVFEVGGVSGARRPGVRPGPHGQLPPSHGPGPVRRPAGAAPVRLVAERRPPVDPLTDPQRLRSTGRASAGPSAVQRRVSTTKRATTAGDPEVLPGYYVLGRRGPPPPW